MTPDPDLHRLDVRDAAAWADLLDGVDAVCHQAAMVGAGVDVADLPLYAAHNDLGTAALLAAMHGPASTRLVLASSMVVYGEGRYDCAEHGEQRPARARAADLDAGRLREPLPALRRGARVGLVAEDARLDPRSSYAASKVAQEHSRRRGHGRPAAGRSGCATTTSTARGMPRDTPYSGVAAIFRSALEERRAAAGLRGRSARCATSCTSTTSRAANVLAIDAVVGRPVESCGGLQRLLRDAGHHRRIAQLLARVVGRSRPRR